MNCATMADPGEITEDLFLDGRLRLRQPRRGHRAGHDALLLAALVPARPGQRVVEFGAGVGAAGLAVASRVGALDLALVEIDPALAALAAANAAANGVAAQVVRLDVTAGAAEFSAAGLGPDSADMVLMNPPFNDPARHRASPDPGRQAAHMATVDTLAAWVHAARRVLRPGGVVSLIWRADGLADVLGALDRGLGSVEVIPVHPEVASPAIRVLVRAVKGGRAPLVLHPPLVLGDGEGHSSAAARAVLGGQAALPVSAMPACDRSPARR
jgi:tRNA1(Val) A37 N6-methylase TrmN6